MILLRKSRDLLLPKVGFALLFAALSACVPNAAINWTSTASVAIAPSAVSVPVNGTYNFTATGGMAPYSYSVIAVSGGTGTVTSAGSFTAPALAGVNHVRVTDSSGATSDAVVTVTLAFSAPATSVATNGTATYAASGGTAPYTYSVSGGGTINSSTGAYTAPATPGTVTITATDAMGSAGSITVMIYGALAISPTTYTLAVNDSFTFAATGGVAPYTYSATGGATINASTGAYTAPASSGTGTVTVTDSLGSTSSATVTVNPAPAISPNVITLAVNNATTFTATGGVAPYTYSTNNGVINASTGAYTAPATTGTATVTVTDSLGNVSSATVTVNPALVISPATYAMATNDSALFSASGGVSPYTFSLTGTAGGTIAAQVYTPAATGTETVTVTDALGNISSASVTVLPALAITPTTYVMAVNNTASFGVSGGVSPYTYSVTGTAGGSVAGGVYTPAASGTATVTVTDSLGNFANASVTVNPPLAMVPAAVTVDVGNTYSFMASGGVGPYTFTVASGPGSITTAGVYTAPANADLGASVKVTDALGNVSAATVAIRMFSAGYNHACAVVNGSALCWGDNTYGELGNGTITASTTPVAVQMPVAAGPVQAISAGYYFTCAIAGGTAYCWGDPALGDLGNGTNVGNVLKPAPVLGVGGVGNLTGVTNIFAGGDSGCAIASGSVYCWGYNLYGQLGNNSTVDSYTPVQVLGVGGTGTLSGATGIVVGLDFTCANVSGSVYCWGYNFDGELGNNSTVSSSTPVQVMGAGGAGFLTGATAITAGYYHACANVSGAPYCWGYNFYGTLGNNSTASSSTPVAVSGVGGTGTLTGVTALAAGYNHTCANAAGTTVCWGNNVKGEIGNSTLALGSSTSTPLSTGLVGVQGLGAGLNFTCGTVSGAGLYCWGDNTLGQYGSASASSQTPILSISMP